MSTPPHNSLSEDLGDPLTRNRTWRAFQILMQSVSFFWLRFQARGIERLPKTGGALLIINHQSFLDPLLVGLPLQRPVSFLARDSLFRVPVVGWILRNTYVVPINRDAASTAALRESIRRMQAGFLVGIFPEGTRSADGNVGEFKPGFLSLVRRTGLPVCPVGVAGAYEAMPRGATIARPGIVRVVYGEPIPAEVFADRSRDDALQQLVRDAVIACQQEAARWRAGA